MIGLHVELHTPSCMFISLILTDQLMEEQKIAKTSQEDLVTITSESIMLLTVTSWQQQLLVSCPVNLYMDVLFLLLYIAVIITIIYIVFLLNLGLQLAFSCYHFQLVKCMGCFGLDFNCAILFFHQSFNNKNVLFPIECYEILVFNMWPKDTKHSFFSF